MATTTMETQQQQQQQKVTKYQAGDYIYMEPKIGTGSFARVYKGYHKTTGQLVAVKVINTTRLSKNNQKLKQHLADEIAIMKPLDHKNIVKMYDAYVVCVLFAFVVSLQDNHERYKPLHLTSQGEFENGDSVMIHEKAYTGFVHFANVLLIRIFPRHTFT
jgi:serine/threonine protein kinase